MLATNYPRLFAEAKRRGFTELVTVIARECQSDIDNIRADMLMCAQNSALFLGQRDSDLAAEADQFLSLILKERVQ